MSTPWASTTSVATCKSAYSRDPGEHVRKVCHTRSRDVAHCSKLRMMRTHLLLVLADAGQDAQQALDVLHGRGPGVRRLLLRHSRSRVYAETAR